MAGFGMGLPAGEPFVFEVPDLWPELPLEMDQCPRQFSPERIMLPMG